METIKILIEILIISMYVILILIGIYVLFPYVIGFFKKLLDYIIFLGIIFFYSGKKLQKAEEECDEDYC